MEPRMKEHDGEDRARPKTIEKLEAWLLPGVRRHIPLVGWARDRANQHTRK